MAHIIANSPTAAATAAARLSGCSYIHGYNEGNPVKDIAKKYGIVR